MNSNVTVGPDVKRVSHHLMLDDGITSIGLILCDGRGKPVTDGAPWSFRQTPSPQTGLRVTQGDSNYSDYELPYTPMTQKDWSGGRGLEDFEKDKTRFCDSFNIDTRMGDIILGPKATTTTILPTRSSVPGYTAESAALFLYSDFLATKNEVHCIRVWLKNTTAGVVNETVVCEVYTDSAGEPGAKLARAEAVMEAGNSDFQIVDFYFAKCALTVGTKYWLYVPNGLIGDAPYSTSAGRYAETGRTIKYFNTGNGQYVTLYSNTRIAFIEDYYDPCKVRFFQYLGAQYAVTIPENGNPSRIFLNGYRGLLNSDGTLDQYVPEDALIDGCVMVITGGKGSNERQNWRRIVTYGGTGTTSTINIDKPWKMAHDTTTEYAILGTNTWTELTGHGLTKPITDIAVCNGMVYFAQGEDTPIRRVRWYNNAGTWSMSATAENANATYIKVVPTTTGTRQVWKFNNGTSAITAAYAKPVAPGGATLDFATKPTEVTGDYPIPVGDAGSKITGVCVYGAPRTPWVFKEDEFGPIANGIYAPVPLEEFSAVRSSDNGKASRQFGIYLFLSMLDGMERYYDNRLDDIGPNKDQGFPAERKGTVSDMIGYPGGMYLSIDAGGKGYSSVLFWNQLGYHDLYRSPLGQSITNVQVQVLPGDTCDRLWVAQGDKAIWLYTSINPRRQADYQYTNTGYVISSWFNGGFGEVDKFWRSVRLFAEDLYRDAYGNQTYVNFYWQTDVDTTWHQANARFETSPVDEIGMGNTSYYDVHGKRWRYKIELCREDGEPKILGPRTPRVKAVTVDAITRLNSKKIWSISFLAEDGQVDLQGDIQTLSAASLIEKLNSWANSDIQPTPLTLTAPIDLYNGKRVLIDSVSTQPIEVEMEGSARRVKTICQMNIYEA